MSDPASSERRIGSPPQVGNENLYPPGYTASYALIIGINYAGNANHAIPRLANAVADAEAIAACLPRYEFQHIRILREEEATCDNIRSALDDLTDPRRVKENDRIFIFYAGHGEFREVTTRDGKERRGYLIPYDDDDKWANRIPMDDLRDTWEASPAKHVMVILDACYSGLANGRRSTTSANATYDSAVTRYRARQIITAGTSDETIDDLFYTENGGASRHSHLTHVLVKTLESGSLPHYDNINAETLYEHLREQIVTASKNRQRPTFGNHGHERGVVLLSRPGVNLPGELYTTLHSNDAGQIGGALTGLAQLLESKERQFQAGDVTEDGVEEWRTLAANEAMRLFREQTDEAVLRQVSRLLFAILARSPRLPDQLLPELVTFLHDSSAARVEQAATMLVQLANGTPALETSLRPLLAEPERIALETTLGQSNSDQLTFSALWALVKFFPDAALPWLRLRLADTRAPELLQRLAMEHLAVLGSSIDIWLIKQAVERRPLSDTLRYEAIQRLRDLLTRLEQKLDPASRNAALELLRASARADANPAVRGLAAEALVKLTGDASLAVLALALKDPDLEQRRQAVALLASLPPNSTHLEELCTLLDDCIEQETMPDVRSMLVSTLGTLWRTYRGTRESELLQARLRQVLEREQQADVRRAAAQALVDSGDFGGYRLVLDYVQQNLAMWRAVRPALEATTDPNIVTRLVSVIPPLSEHLVEAGLVLLGSLGSNLSEAQERERNTALETMLIAAREQGDPAFLPLLKRLLSQPPAGIEITDDTAEPQAALYLRAMDALGTFPRALALPLAQERLQHSLANQQTHGPALIVLASVFAALSGPDAVLALLDILQADEASVRQAAANALLRLLSSQDVDTEVRNKLNVLLAAEPAPEVRAALAKVLQVIA